VHTWCNKHLHFYDHLITIKHIFVNNRLIVKSYLDQVSLNGLGTHLSFLERQGSDPGHSCCGKNGLLNICG